MHQDDDVESENRSRSQRTASAWFVRVRAVVNSTMRIRRVFSEFRGTPDHSVVQAAALTTTIAPRDALPDARVPNVNCKHMI
jgi:hypothetical protein